MQSNTVSSVYDAMGDKTIINDVVAGEGKKTSLNTTINGGLVLSVGDVICNKYTIQQKMDVSSGEADLFLCTYGKGTFVAKVYRRAIAVKPEVIEALAGVYSPYIAQIFELGECEGYPVEILPFYKNGSLENKRFSYEELKENIIPALNEGLRVLHENGIIHKDLKPSNIMMNNDGRTVSIIDFGISSIREKDSTIILTKTGMTPEYSAPETFKGLFLNESDYYSLGITIYELFEGHTPYFGLFGEDLERLLSVQKIPLPENMPEDLKALISALTYSDITNRRDKTNPDRRWTYEEVKNWCNGVSQPVPGGSSAYSGNAGNRIIAYKFLGKSYTSNRDLVIALNENWNDGKKQLFRGLLSAYYKQIDAEIAGKCIDAELAVEKGDADVIFFGALYDIDSEMADFLWKGYRYQDLSELGDKLLECLRQNNDSMNQFIDEILRKHILSIYYKIQHRGEADEQMTVLEAFESRRKNITNDVREKQIENYQLAYVLSGKRDFVLDDKSFATPTELCDYLIHVLDSSFDKFIQVCNRLITDNNTLDIQLESWLLIIGKESELERWRKSLGSDLYSEQEFFSRRGV